MGPSLDENLRMEDVTDDDLMRLYRDGDAEAFDTLFDRYHTSVYNFAGMMLIDGMEKAAQGVSSIEEVLHVVPVGTTA